MSEQATSTKELVREGIEAINERDAATLRDLVAEDVVVHGQAGQEIRGREAVVDAQLDRPAFPDAHLELESMVEEGDTVAVRMRFTGTHEGPMAGIDPTGREIEIRVMAMYRVAEGQLAEAWFVEDDADTLRQLGVWGELAD